MSPSVCLKCGAKRGGRNDDDAGCNRHSPMEPWADDTRPERIEEAARAFPVDQLKEDLRRLFAEYGVDVAVGRFDGDHLFLQSRDLRIMTIEESL